MSGSLLPQLHHKRAMSMWFWAIFTLFFTRGVLMATWSTQGPALRDALDLDLVAMGWYAACLSVGSVTGVLISERLVERMGSRKFSFLSYSILSGALILLGLNLAWELTPLSFVITVFFGLPLGMADYDNNLEATNINRDAGKNKVPLLHGGYSAGVLVGSALVGIAIIAGIGVTPDFIAVGAIMLVLSLIATQFIGKDNGKAVKENSEDASPVTKIKMSEIIVEKRTRHIGLIAFAFVFSEGVGVVWIPISLVQNGFEASEAAFGAALFGMGFVIMRFIGGPIADKIGRQKVVLYSALTASLGIIVFILTPVINMPLPGALLWGLGNSIGLAMGVAALGDDATRVAARMSFLWTIVYIANLVVGPTIGLLSGIGGLFLAFVAPLVFLVLAATVSHSVDEEHPDAVKLEGNS